MRYRLVLAAAVFCGSMAVCASAQDVDAATKQFRAWDNNGDNQISRDELPAAARRNFERVDVNRDGAISLDEHRAFVGRGAKSQAIDADVEVLRDIEYVAGGHERQKLDLYLPKQRKVNNRLPLVIWIHGGGWRNGSKDGCPAVGFVNEAFAVASINYRLSSHAIFPAQIHDCKAAIRFLRKQADVYGIDANRIGVWGASAGGHLAALVGTSAQVAELEGALGDAHVSSRVQAVCDYFGPTDLLKMDAQSGSNSRIEHNAKDSPESLLVGGPIQETRERAQVANPIRYVSADDPPFLIVHGDRDPLVPHQQSELLYQALASKGLPAKLDVIEGGGHGPFRDAERMKVVVSFFREALAPTPESKQFWT